MSGYNGSGTYVISGTGLPYVSGTVISATVANQLNTDLATGLSNCITKDGQQTVTANIPWNGNKITGLGAPTTTGDALSWGRIATLGATTFSGTTTFPDGGTWSTTGIAATVVNTGSGTQSCLNNTATTLFAVPTTTAAMFLVTCGFGVSDPSDYTTVALVTVDNAARRIVSIQTATDSTLSMSGANVQVTQTQGGTQTANWAYLRIQ